MSSLLMVYIKLTKLLLLHIREPANYKRRCSPHNKMWHWTNLEARTVLVSAQAIGGGCGRTKRKQPRTHAGTRLTRRQDREAFDLNTQCSRLTISSSSSHSLKAFQY